MKYTIRPVESVEVELANAEKRDKALYKQIIKKLDKIAENPYTVGKWMHGDYVGVREVHFMHGKYVLMFKIDDKESVISIVKLEHHPERY